MWGIRRMRFATGVDDDLARLPRGLRRRPADRPRRPGRPRRCARAASLLPWESLAAAITEQLIEFERAVAIQRRLIARLGRRCPRTGLRDAPSPATVAAAAPAELAAMDLAPTRALTLRRAAAEVAAGRVDLLAADPMPGWRRLRAIPGIGPWTLEMLAYYGQGHHDRIPAGDLGYLKLVGRITTGHPKARATEEEVRAFFAPYGEWKGLAGEYVRWPPPAGCSRSVLLERAPRVEPLARQELVRQHPLRGLRLREQALVVHPVDVGLPLGRRPGSPRAARRRRGRRPAASRRPPPPAGRGRARGRPRAARRSPAAASSRSASWPLPVAWTNLRTSPPKSWSRSRRRTTRTSSE